jgi:hypothetical protein
MWRESCNVSLTRTYDARPSALSAGAMTGSAFRRSVIARRILVAHFLPPFFGALLVLLSEVGI